MFAKVAVVYLVASLTFVGIAPAVASAQTWNGTITGMVVDPSHAVVTTATVTITAPTLIGGAQSSQTTADGRYRFTVLPAGVYEIAVRADGFRSVRRSGVRLPSGGTVTIDFALEIAGVLDELEVRGRSPVVDVKSAGVPVRLDADQLHNLPTSRSLADLINLAPGISADVSFGGSQKSNEILVEGVRMTEPLFQDPLLRVNHNWLQEVNIVALGAGAEHGGFTGAAAHAMFRSGTNQFNGLGEFWTTRPGWLASNTQKLSDQLRRQFVSRELLEWRDTSAQVGGPLRRDRLWFFTGLQHTRHEDRPAGFSGPGSRDERDLQFMFKPTVSVSPALRLEGFVGPGVQRINGDGISPIAPIETSNDVRRRQVSWNARALWTINAVTLGEIRHGGYDVADVADPHPPATRQGPSGRYDLGTGSYSVATDYYFEQDSTIHTTSATLTHYREQLLGRSHDVKLGLEYEHTAARQVYGYPGGRIYYDLFGEPSEVVFWDGQAGNANTGRTVAFAQDTWALNNTLTLSPGVRLEWNRGSVPNKPGVFSTITLGPRLGLAWDVSSDHRTVVRAHYGHYYDTIFSSRIMQDDTSEAGNPSIYAFVVGPDQFVEYFRTSPVHRFAIDRDLRHSHVKQLVLGIEREVFTDVSVQAQYLRRRFGDFMGLIDTGSIYEPVQRPDPGADGILNTADDGDAIAVFNLTNPNNQSYLYTNPSGAFNRYDAVQVVGRKRYSRDWQLQASYTWSKNRGTVGNRWHVNAARYDLGQPGRFVNPNLNINAFGRATFDPTHEGKVLGSYRLPFSGTMVSGVYRYTTGQAWGRRANITGLRQGRNFVRVEPQGTRRLPAINTLAFRLEQRLAVPRVRGTIGIFADVFNLFNQGVPNSDHTEAINDFSGARFGEPNAWLDPRTLRAGLRLTF